jgi:hypothetical protein
MSGLKCIVSAALLALWVAAGVPARAQGLGQPMDLERRVVVTEKEAIALMPAELVCEPMIVNMAFSDSGRYLLLTRQALKLTTDSVSQLLAGRRQPPIETSILLWDARDRETRTLWKASGSDNVQVTSLSWLPGTEVALALTYEHYVPPAPRNPGPNSLPARATTRQSLLRILPGSDRAQLIASTVDLDQDSFHLQVSPTSSMAILRRDIFPADSKERGPASLQQTVTVIGSDGRLGKSFPASTELIVYDAGWTDDGKPVLYGQTRRTATAPPSQKRLLLDPRSGATTTYESKLAAPPMARAARETNAKLGVKLKSGATTVKEGQTTLPVGTLWLETTESSEKPRVLVSADSPGGQFTPGGDAVLFHSQGSLLVAPIVRIDKATLAAARETARRMVVLNNGKQIGLAAHMYAQDHDEVLPNAEDINSKLNPYIKSPGIFEGFNYTFSGGPIKDVAKPAETELGFVTGPGGRAVIYVDGHVMWKQDK